MLDRILDEVDNGVTFEGGEGAEAEVAMIMFDSNMAHFVVELERQTEEVMIVTAITHQERAHGLIF